MIIITTLTEQGPFELADCILMENWNFDDLCRGLESSNSKAGIASDVQVCKNRVLSEPGSSPGSGLFFTLMSLSLDSLL